ncbi:Ras- protein Rab-4A, partial [Coelomomyces lativittatus]
LVYIEASSITGNHVQDAFHKCASIILSKIEAGEINPEHSNNGMQYGNATLKSSRLYLQPTRTDDNS